MPPRKRTRRSSNQSKPDGQQHDFKRQHTDTYEAHGMSQPESLASQQSNNLPSPPLAQQATLGASSQEPLQLHDSTRPPSSFQQQNFQQQQQGTQPHTRPGQRHRPQLQREIASLPQVAQPPPLSSFQHEHEPIPPMQIHIKWSSPTGKTKITELPLKMVASTNDLTGVHKRLTSRVFTERNLPDFLVSDKYLKFSTCEECLNMPLDVLSTNFKLAAFKDGWQYVVHDSRVSAPEASDNKPKLHVTIIEFDSIAHIIGHLGIRMSMVAYPLITIHKEFLLTTLNQLRTDPSFKGIFSDR